MYTRSRSSTGGPGAGFGGGRGQMNQGNGNFPGQNNSFNNQGGNYQQPNFGSGSIQPSAPFKPAMTMLQLQALQNRQQAQGPNGNHNQQQQSPMRNQQNQNQNQQSPMQNHQSPNQNQQRSTPVQNQQNSNKQNANASQQQQQQNNSTPTSQKIKPILKQTNTPTSAMQQSPTTPAPSSVPTPSPAAATVPKPNPPQKPIDAGAAAKTPVAPPPPKIPAKIAPAVVADAPVVEPIVENQPKADGSKLGEGGDNEDPQRWAEDDQSKWADNDEQNSQWMDTEDGQQQLPKWRRLKKIAANKPNKKLKRLRMNQRLRKTLMPKNAIMVLNEMKAGVQFTFPETQAIMPNSLFLVHAELEGKVYVGQGLSKPLARQNAAENALKCLLLEKMTAAAMKERVETAGEASMDTSEPTPTPEVDDKSVKDTAESIVDETGTDKGDDIPWSSLASFALYKLFLEWQNQGTVVPIPRPGVPALMKNRAEPKPSTEKVLPPNALDIHPVMLLNQMKPGTTYNEVGRQGNPPNIMFTLGVEISGETYTGSAKNKKDAKKVAAKSALKALYNLEYPEEPKMEGVEVAQ